MKDADKAESNIPLASIVKPAGVSTASLHVMSNTCLSNPIAALDITLEAAPGWVQLKFWCDHGGGYGVAFDKPYIDGVIYRI